MRRILMVNAYKLARILAGVQAHRCRCKSVRCSEQAADRLDDCSRLYHQLLPSCASSRAPSPTSPLLHTDVPQQ